MANTTAQKLKIKEGFTLLTLHAPDQFEKVLQPLPPGVTISTEAKKYQQVHWFVTNKAQLEKELNKVLKLVNNDVLCWIYYPKGSSKIQTDLTRDKGWDTLLAHTELQWISLVAFDETWSTFGFRMRTEPVNVKTEKPQPREILNYIDAKKKEVRLPDDLATALDTSQVEEQFFKSLSFTNKKEYVEWVITAKRDETPKTTCTANYRKAGKMLEEPRKYLNRCFKNR